MYYSLVVANRVVLESPDCVQSGNTSLHLAAAHGHSDICQLLVKHGAEINRAGCNGQTPLMQACVARMYATGKVLLALGASTSDCDFDKNTPLHLTCMCQGKELIENETDFTIDMIRALMDATNQSAGSHRAYIHAHNGKKETALHIAASSRRLKLVQCLVGEFQANLTLVDRHGDTPLHLCGKSSDVCEYLISQGADPEAKNKDQCTYLEMDEQKAVSPKLKPMDSTMPAMASTGSEKV